MKKTILMLFLALFSVTATAFAQQKKSGAEVLYFKAGRADNKSKTVDALELKVKEMIEKNWADKTVTFREVRLGDSSNKELVKRNNAQSQTLVIVVTRKGIETTTDISAILRLYASNNDAVQLEKELTEKITEAIRQ